MRAARAMHQPLKINPSPFSLSQSVWRERATALASTPLRVRHERTRGSFSQALPAFLSDAGRL